jgi:GT2 family glycosyltransferase
VQKSLLKAEIKSEIIVVDNSSNDDSCTIIKNKYPSVLLLENQTNMGFSKANNIGASKASGKYICVLNPDIVLNEDTFSKILEFYESGIKVGFVGCHMIDGTGVFFKRK